jgi:RHS repeat-associated protein
VDTVPGTNAVEVRAADGRGNVSVRSYEIDVTGSPEALSYDAPGNLVLKTDSSGVWTYEWNVRSQLVAVGKDGIEVARFAYDPLGRRVEKVADGVTTSYLYDGEDILQETITEGPGSGTFRYIHGPSIDEPLARESLSTGAAEYLHADGLGSIVATTDAAGNVTSRRQYDAWGNLELGADQPGYAFTGREWDPETGLYYYRARYYDPKIGRFISEDPIGLNAGDPNFYAYVANNPSAAIDPFGLAPEPPPSWPTPPANIPGGPWTWYPDAGNSRGGVLRGPAVAGGQQPNLT